MLFFLKVIAPVTFFCKLCNHTVKLFKRDFFFLILLLVKIVLVLFRNEKSHSSTKLGGRFNGSLVFLERDLILINLSDNFNET